MSLIGIRFGRWLVIGDGGRKRYPKSVKVMWKCRCDCGHVGIVAGTQLRRGTSRSCGCLHRELMSKRSYRHGRSGSTAYKAALAAFHRCNNPKCNVYANYGGRGIHCDFPTIEDMAEWIDVNLGVRPKVFSLDRIDNDGHYTIEWSSKSDQRKNVRPNLTNATNGQLAQEIARRGGWVVFESELKNETSKQGRLN